MIPPEMVTTIWTMITAIVAGIIAWCTIRVQTGNSKELQLINELQEAITMLNAEIGALKAELRIVESDRRMYERHSLELQRYVNNRMKGPRPEWPTRKCATVSADVSREMKEEIKRDNDAREVRLESHDDDVE